MRKFQKRKGIIAICVLLLAAVSAVGQDAVVRELRGKVEVRIAGGAWSAATVGQVVPVGATISTGFGAQAQLEVGDATISVQPLTRLSIEELVAEQGSQRTDLFLGVGRVRANVRTGEDTAHDFKVRSAVSTAAVRGTEFEYDGFSVTGFIGVIVFESDEGFQQVVGQGDESSYDPGERPTSPRTEKRNRARPDSSPNPQTQTERRRRNQGNRPPLGNRRDQGPGADDDLGPNATVGIGIVWPD